MGKIVFRSYRSGDEEEIASLLNLAFDGWPSFNLSCILLEHWQWKYRDELKK